MSLSSEEKRALRDKQKLLFSSGQFPLTGGSAARKRALKKRRSPLKTLLIAVATFLAVVIGLVMVVTKAARADTGAPPADPPAKSAPGRSATEKAAPATAAPEESASEKTAPEQRGPRKIDVELHVHGERPGPGVVFVDGGRELLRKRMRELSLEAGRLNASLREQRQPAGPPAVVRVLRVDITSGDVARAALARPLARLARGVAGCWAGTLAAGRLTLVVDLAEAGRVAGTRVDADTTKREQAWACAQQALVAARWPTPAPDERGATAAQLAIDLRVAPARARSR